MNDPYQILGVRPDASDDEIKKAYRDLAKKYHPDNYATSGGDASGEKMKEINAAYDEILARRARGDSYYNATDGATNTASFAEVRRMIAAGRIAEAELILEQTSDHSAEWQYCKGLCAMYRRRYHDAAYFFSEASRMDPTNPEYQASFDRFRSAQQRYGSFTPDGQARECGVCDICSGLICADCLCECCGGDLIGCC